MKFKIDQNLPAEYAAVLRESGFEAETVDQESLGGVDDAAIAERCRSEGRVPVTLDIGFADIRSYPPREHPGIIVVRSKAQDIETLISLLKRVLMVLPGRSPRAQLCVVEADRIRFRD